MRFIQIPVNFLALITVIATALSFAGSNFWVFALMEHPRLQYIVVLFAALIINLLAFKKHREFWIYLCILALQINFILVFPLFIPNNHSSDKIQNTSVQTISLIHATLDSKQPNVSQAVKYLNQQQADILFLLEVTPFSIFRLIRGLTNYRLVGAQPKFTSHGIACFVPKKKTKPIKPIGYRFISLPKDNNRPLMQTLISYAGRKINLLCFHVISPRNAETVAYQKVELEALAKWSKRVQQNGKQDLIVIGDFNSTPWYKPFRELLNTSGLLDSQYGFGIQNTWNSYFPAFLRIPIDTCLHSKSFTTIHRSVGADIGSDHLPLFVELNING